MTAFNAVRFRVKPGREQEFLDAHKKIVANWPGLERVNMIQSGERSYCIIAEWVSMDALAKARPNMIATLDTFRHTLEDLGGGLGVSDPVSGDVILELKRKSRSVAKKAKTKKTIKTVQTKKRANKRSKLAKKTKANFSKKH